VTPAARQIIRELCDRGVRLTARADGLAYDAPAAVMTPQLLAALAACKGELMARLSGRPYPSTVPGIVHDPQGGVRVTNPADLRTLCVEQAGRRGFPAVLLSVCSQQVVSSSPAAWRAFAAGARLGEVAEALLVLDDIAGTRMRSDH
jgi:tubulysin polyketide synthase-like protein